MLCTSQSVPTVPDLYFWLLTAPHNDYIDEDNDYIDEELPDEDEPDASFRAPASLILPSNPVANKSYALPQTRKSIMAGWDICNMMCLPGGWGLEQATVDVDSAMPPEGLPPASERAGGESKNTGLKRKIGEISGIRR
jgi:hypothetical protein